MTLKEWAEQNGKTLEEAYELTGLTHWKQTVPEEIAPEEIEPKKVVEPVVEKTESQKRYESTLKRVKYEEEKLKKYLGTNSRRYLKYVSDHRKYIPEAYEEVKAQINRSL